ncbi:MAG: hypothetical protein HYX94_09985 [Chloroflexi bacterium]|nr:hypothetical protein [Chloroflexota bacterium]
MMRRVFTLQNEPMYKMAKVLDLHEIPHDDFAAFIKDRFAATNRLIADDVIDHLLNITGGHPHDTQELCYFTWSLVDAAGEASIETVGQALAQVLDAEDDHYTNLWEGLIKKQRLLLMALTKAGASSEIYSEEFRKRYELGPASSLQNPSSLWSSGS